VFPTADGELKVSPRGNLPNTHPHAATEDIKAVDAAGSHYRSSPTLLGEANALGVRGEKRDTERGDHDFPTIPLAGDALSLKYDGRVEL
jgi:hypothetical protein